MQFSRSGFIPTDGSQVDFGRGPWSSIEEYFSIIPRTYRMPGMEFLVTIPGGYEEYRLVGGVDLIHAQLTSTSTNENVSYWITPPVDMKVDVLPGTPTDGYRVLHNAIIKEYEVDTWVDKHGGTGVALQQGMAVIVNKVTIEGVDYINQIYVYEEVSEAVFEWVRKTETIAPNWDMFYTIYVNNKRRVRDLTVAPDIVLDVRSITNSGIYFIRTNLENLPAEVYALNPVQYAFVMVNFKDEQNIHYFLSTKDNMYTQSKVANVYGLWKTWQGIQGEPGLPGTNAAEIIAAAFTGDDMVFTKDDTTSFTIPNAKLELKGNPGEAAAEILSASFVGDNIVFTKEDATTFTLVDAVPLLKGLNGDPGESPIFRIFNKLIQYKYDSEIEWTTIGDLSDYLSKTSNVELEGTGLRILRINDVGGVEAVETIEYSNILPYPNVEVTDDFVLNETMNGATLLVNKATNVICTIPVGLLISPDLSFQVNIVQMGLGIVTVVGATGVTLRSPRGDNQSRTQYSIMNIMKLSNNTFLLGGDIA